MSDASDYESGPFCGKCFQSPEDCECKAEAAKAEAEQLNRRITELEAKRDAERAEHEAIVEKLQADLASSHARAERWKSRLKDRQRTRPCKHAREAARYYREVTRLRAAIEAHREVANERLMAFGEHADFDERLWAALAGGGNAE